MRAPDVQPPGRRRPTPRRTDAVLATFDSEVDRLFRMLYDDVEPRLAKLETAFHNIEGLAY